MSDGDARRKQRRWDRSARGDSGEVWLRAVGSTSCSVPSAKLGLKTVWIALFENTAVHLIAYRSARSGCNPNRNPRRKHHQRTGRAPGGAPARIRRRFGTRYASLSLLGPCPIRFVFSPDARIKKITPPANGLGSLFLAGVKFRLRNSCFGRRNHFFSRTQGHRWWMSSPYLYVREWIHSEHTSG